ncbi:hypothetical protein L6452_01380 [Arctium lappa]|uniref:Uncharacterized protein n=1 Tax=Arctium lappa TaxID=4217 RepID=A0ACB9FHI9_ARCLA|nr:hypothetical protein L6452_01380 [Arctium lappa]
MSSVDSRPELPEMNVPQPMLLALLGRKKAKLENERMLSRHHKSEYEETSRKLWEKSIAMDKLLSKIKKG